MRYNFKISSSQSTMLYFPIHNTSQFTMLYFPIIMLHFPSHNIILPNSQIFLPPPNFKCFNLTFIKVEWIFFPTSKLDSPPVPLSPPPLLNFLSALDFNFLPLSLSTYSITSLSLSLSLRTKSIWEKVPLYFMLSFCNWVSPFPLHSERE